MQSMMNRMLSSKGKTLDVKTAAAVAAMQDDADMKAEATMIVTVAADSASGEEIGMDEVPLNVKKFSHQANSVTRKLCEDIGGVEKLKEFTAKFYKKAFKDPHLDKFIREHDDHHGERFAFWIAEKMGIGSPWTEERSRRKACPFSAHGYHFEGAHDRSSAHFSAWHSPKRDHESWGEHFKLDDCRVWMRLHFWAAREAGVLDTPFGAYYIRFIAHFVSVYEGTAPPFVRDAARWSQDPVNIQRYLDNNRSMPDIMNISYQEALDQIPVHERSYTGSAGIPKLWPYELSVSQDDIGFASRRH